MLQVLRHLRSYGCVALRPLSPLKELDDPAGWETVRVAAMTGTGVSPLP
jgi:hypothetical protein